MKNLWLVALSFLLIVSCKTSKETLIGKNEVLLEDLDIIGKKYPYRPSAERVNDLIHTALNVSFDWNNQHLFGEATLTLAPFYRSCLR